MEAYSADVERKMKRFFDWLSEKDRRRYAGPGRPPHPRVRPPSRRLSWDMGASSTSPAFCNVIPRRFARVCRTWNSAPAPPPAEGRRQSPHPKPSALPPYRPANAPPRHSTPSQPCRNHAPARPPAATVGSPLPRRASPAACSEYSSRFSRRASARPSPACCSAFAARKLASSAVSSARISSAGGRFFFAGGISPSRTRSCTFTHAENELGSARSKFNAVRSSPPFFVSASWQASPPCGAGSRRNREEGAGDSWAGSGLPPARWSCPT